MTLVSVTMATYNRNELLFGRALPSVLAQTHRDLEINIVSDGMAGAELDELEKGIKQLPRANIKLWRVPRQSYPEDEGTRWLVLGMNARNHALDNATGDWIAPLDDDDEWTSDHVESLLSAALGAEVDFAYGRSQYHWADGRDNQFAGTWPPGVGAFCDGAQVYRNGLGYRYDPGCVERGLPEDGDMWDRMVKGGVSFTFLPQLIHHYYPNPR